MRAKHILLLLVVSILNSCDLLKSLQPFYTNKTIQFEKLFLGSWKTEKGGEWNVYTFEEYNCLTGDEDYLEEIINGDINKEELEEFEKIKNHFKYTYFVKICEATFLAVAFKIKNQLFLDFSLFDAKLGTEINSISLDHLIGTHTLVKLDILNNNQVDLSWFPEKNLQSLISNNKIKINHEIIGKQKGEFSLGGSPEEGILPTASSEELQKFLAKYMRSNDYQEWIHEEKNPLFSSYFQLKRTNG
jgi:hypothetical protein